MLKILKSKYISACMQILNVYLLIKLEEFSQFLPSPEVNFNKSGNNRKYILSNKKYIFVIVL